MDKNIELLDSQISNLKRKIDFNSNMAYQQEKESSNERAKMGFRTVEGAATVAEQVPGLVAELPELFRTVEKRVGDLVKLY